MTEIRVDNLISPDQFDGKFEKGLETEKTRKKIINVFNEEVQKEDFIKRIQRYAAEEMDRRVFRSWKYWTVVIFTALITSTIGFFIAST